MFNRLVARTAIGCPSSCAGMKIHSPTAWIAFSSKPYPNGLRTSTSVVRPSFVMTKARTKLPWTCAANAWGEVLGSTLFLSFGAMMPSPILDALADSIRHRCFGAKRHYWRGKFDFPFHVHCFRASGYGCILGQEAFRQATHRQKNDNPDCWKSFPRPRKPVFHH